MPIGVNAETMRVCANCGRENPDDRDFCECGEYLRWDPTGVVQAITPEILQASQQPPAAPPPDAPAQPPQPPAPVPTLRQPAVPAAPAPPPPPVQPAQPGELDPAAISLRLPDGAPVGLGDTVAVGVEPGQRARVLALVRNQSGIVDNYELMVRGLPDDWWSIFPNTLYLVPFGTSGTYEQEVEIHLHPPRAAEAEARIWELQVVAESKAYSRQAAVAPLHLGIQPFEEFKTKLSPERASGRKQARYDVAVRNLANAPVTVAMDAADQDNELSYTFTPATIEIPPGQSIGSKLLVRAPRQKWIGRAEEKRIQVFTRTGEAAELPEAEGEGEGEGEGEESPKQGLLGRLRVTGPRAQVGTGGLRVQGPRVAKPVVPSKNVDLMKLKAPGGGIQAPQAPLMPNQVVFRHKAWLPWWIALLVPLLILLALLLFLFLPKNVVVPDVTGAKSTFEAEKKLTAAELRLNPTTKQEVSTKAPPGTVISQTPAAGEKVKKDSEVSILVALGNGEKTVPAITGRTLSEADTILRNAKLTTGQVSPQPPDPKAKIKSQIPAANEVVPQGTPISVFLSPPSTAAAAKGAKKDKKKTAAAAGGAVPAVAAGASATVIAHQVAAKGIVPKTVPRYSAAKPDTVVGTKPPAGTKLKAGETLTLFVSVGPPVVAYDDGEDIQLANGTSGKPLEPIAGGPRTEKDPTFAPVGRRVAYAAEGQIFTLDLARPDATARRLTDPARVYTDPAWAPTPDRDILAMALQTSDSESELCLGQIKRGTMDTRCKSVPATQITRSIHWSGDGRSILAFAKRDGGLEQGIMRWRSSRAFSPDPGDWSAAEFVTPVSQAGEGVIDAVPSPNGKSLAVAANFGSEGFRLYLAKPGDFELSRSPVRTRVRACKIAWRPDSKQLVVVEADDVCHEEVGTLARLSVSSPNDSHTLSATADNPVFEPMRATRP